MKIQNSNFKFNTPLCPPLIRGEFKGGDFKICNLQFAICNSRKGSGFTLIEILLVLSIVGIMLSVTLPVSYSMYQRYQSSLKAEDVLVLLSSLRRESFLYGEEKLVHSENGRLFINNESKDFKDVFVQIDRPVKFYKNGTTSGGEVKIYVKDYTFLIDIESPFGALILRTV